MTERPTRLLAPLAILLVSTAARPQGTGDLVRVSRALIEAHVPGRDDPDALLATLLEAAHGGGPSAALLLDEAARLLGKLQRPAAALAAVEAFAAPLPDGLAATAARRLRARLLVGLGRKRDAVAAHPYRGCADRMLAIGPFGDATDHYLDVVFPPELRFPADGERCAGRYGPVQRRVVKRAPLHRTIDLAGSAGPGPGCFYGLHAVRADSARAGYLEVASVASFAVFVNGHRVARVDRSTATMPSLLRFPIALRAGDNLVLVKTATTNSAEIGLRYLDAAGRLLAGVVPIDPAQASPSSKPDGPVPGPFPEGLAQLADAGRKATGDDRTTLLLGAALTAFRRRDHQLGMELLDLIEAAPPVAGTDALAYAALLEDASPLPSEIRRARAQAVLTPILDGMPEHHAAVMEKVRLLLGQDRREEAVRLLQERVDTGAAGPDTFHRLYQLLTGLHFEAAAERVRCKWHEALPEDPRPVIAGMAARADGGDPRGALAEGRAALERTPIDSLRRRCLQLAADLGETQLALQLHDALWQLTPDRPDALEARAKLLRRLGQMREATDTDRRLARAVDADKDQLHAAGDRLRETGDEAAGLAAYQRSLDLDPSQHDVRRQLARARDADPFATLAPFRRDGDALIRAFKPGDREGTAPSTLVLDQTLVEVQPDGSSVSEVHQIRRINDLRGVEAHQHAEAAANADEVVRLRTIGTDGKSYVPNRVSDSFSMPRLEPGAFVEEVYRNFDSSPRPGPWRLAPFYFRGADEPYLLSELIVVLPPEHPGTFRVRDFPGEPEQRKLEGDRRAWVFRRTDVPRLPIERHAPPLADIVPVVTYGEDDTPQATAHEALAVAHSRRHMTPEVRKCAARVTAGLDGDAAKAAAIHRFVQDKIAGGRGSAEPTAILLRGRGPRFFLEAALLHAAGVPFTDAAVTRARPALLGEAAPFFYGDPGYELPALRIEPRDGNPVWLFADAPRHVPLGMVPEARFSAPALLLRPGEAEPVQLPSGQPGSGTGFAVDAAVAVKADGSADLTAHITLRGYAGFAAAERLRNAEADIRRVVAQQVAGQVLPGWALHHAELVVEPTDQPLRIEVQATRSRALESAGERRLLNLPLAKSDLLSSIGARTPRVLPLALSDLRAGTWDVVVTAVPELRLVRLPDPVTVRRPLLEFDLHFERRDAGVAIHRQLVLNPGELPPGRVLEWTHLLQRLDAAEDQSLEYAPR